MPHSSKPPSPKVVRKTHWVRSTANSPSVFPKASKNDWEKLSTPDQLSALDDVKDTCKHLKTKIMQKASRSLFPNHEPSVLRAESQAAGPESIWYILTPRPCKFTLKHSVFV